MALHIRYQLLSMIQLAELAHSLRAQINNLKLSSLNDTHRISNTLARLNTPNVLLMTLGKHDMPCVHHLISAACRHGDSVHAILKHLGKDVKMVYKPRGYTQDDLEIADLIYCLGGKQLLVALNCHLGLLSCCLLI
ncbi:hypothetical protein CONPUDRAFT_155468 [Coniophora puteana RWD-64-598 SS2]|uniref:Uncharacterized protein n=1 Tax=Coniophora puteana (strain RWD-64-598) TaxID=741705 RepID=A0A5M3MNA6_CONPW|nr:uncharacterized protein CONPUDRAFT_155468 [Coniophora puteana RWD-64-598 SS2]EIW80101.1 hypothetical protein CONPUDRAFT_155468 [Coniophora puteana RWD-64-598 SS2]